MSQNSDPRPVAHRTGGHLRRAELIIDLVVLLFLPTLQFSKPKPQYFFSFVPEKFLVTVCVSPTGGMCG